MNEKGTQMRPSNEVELSPAVFQMVCHLKVLLITLGQLKSLFFQHFCFISLVRDNRIFQEKTHNREGE